MPVCAVHSTAGADIQGASPPLLPAVTQLATFERLDLDCWKLHSTWDCWQLYSCSAAHVWQGIVAASQHEHVTLLKVGSGLQVSQRMLAVDLAAGLLQALPDPFVVPAAPEAAGAEGLRVSQKCLPCPEQQLEKRRSASDQIGSRLPDVAARKGSGYKPPSLISPLQAGFGSSIQGTPAARPSSASTSSAAEAPSTAPSTAAEGEQCTLCRHCPDPLHCYLGNLACFVCTITVLKAGLVCPDCRACFSSSRAALLLLCTCICTWPYLG